MRRKGELKVLAAMRKSGRVDASEVGDGEAMFATMLCSRRLCKILWVEEIPEVELGDRRRRPQLLCACWLCLAST